jgi:hypothetical protein
MIPRGPNLEFGDALPHSGPNREFSRITNGDPRVSRKGEP